MNFGAVHLGALPFFGAVLAPNGNLEQFGAIILILAPWVLAPFGAKVDFNAFFFGAGFGAERCWRRF